VPKVLRRKKSLAVVNRDGMTVESVYCRKCTKSKPPKDFYKSVDSFLDKNGFMSLCRDCISEMYVSQYNIEHDLRRAIYKVCRIINVLYSESAIQALETHLKNKERLPDDPKIFGLYKSKIATSMKGIGAAKMGESVGIDFTFQYENSNVPERGEPIDFTGSESVIEFWGGDFSVDEYRFLEKELTEWKQSYSCQNKAEEFFMKQICLKALELENARKGGGGSVDGILKSMQELLKNGSLTPAQQTAASSGKGIETWGMFIKSIEETTPAEYYKDKELFKDFDGIGEYIKKYITRPLKNFVTGSRDFNITEEDTTEYDEPNLEVTDEPEAGKTEQTISG
jgi:hypothetical protein